MKSRDAHDPDPDPDPDPDHETQAEVIRDLTERIVELESLRISISVLQRWLEELPLRMQSTLLLGLRGPDTHRCPNIKILTRWLRGLTFRPGNPESVADFMFAELPPRIEKKSLVARELEFVTQHYYSHLMHALEVVGYNHSDHEVRDHAYLLYGDICEFFLAA